MMESMRRLVTGLGLEEKGEEKRDRVAELGEAEKKCEGAMTPDNKSTEGIVADCNINVCTTRMKIPANITRTVSGTCKT